MIRQGDRDQKQKLFTTVLIDADNVSARHWSTVAKHLEDWNVQIVKIFGDFSESSLGPWLDIVRSDRKLQPVLQLSGGKNSTDMAIAVAAMDTLYAGKSQAVVLVASDQDYAPVAQRLRSGGVKVFGLGERKTPSSLRQSCTDFEELDQIAIEQKADDALLAAG